MEPLARTARAPARGPVWAAVLATLLLAALSAVATEVSARAKLDKDRVRRAEQHGRALEASLAGPGPLERHPAAGVRERAVLERVGEELVQRQRQRHRLLRRQQHLGSGERDARDAAVVGAERIGGEARERGVVPALAG